MTIKIGNAPCSWGVEFADDPRNPDWRRVLDECALAGYRGIELGPIGYMPQDPGVLTEALAARGLELIGGVVFRPFHDPGQWAELKTVAAQTCRSLAALKARHLVLIDSISPRRAPTAGRPEEAEQLTAAEWKGLVDRVREITKLGREEFGLTASIHPHAAGFIDFERDIERLFGEIGGGELELCLDTGHSAYAGFDSLAFMKKHRDRLVYVHLKDIEPKVKAAVVAKRTDFYKACGQGIFCKLGRGMVDFGAVRSYLLETHYAGWCTVEQDCDPAGPTSPLDDARFNRDYLCSIGFQ